MEDEVEDDDVEHDVELAKSDAPKSPCAGTNRRPAPDLCQDRYHQRPIQIQMVQYISCSCHKENTQSRTITHNRAHKHFWSWTLTQSLENILQGRHPLANFQLTKMQSARCWSRLCRRGSRCSSRQLQLGRERPPLRLCLYRNRGKMRLLVKK